MDYRALHATRLDEAGMWRIAERIPLDVASSSSLRLAVCTAPPHFPPTGIPPLPAFSTAARMLLRQRISGCDVCRAVVAPRRLLAREDAVEDGERLIARVESRPDQRPRAGVLTMNQGGMIPAGELHRDLPVSQCAERGDPMFTAPDEYPVLTVTKECESGSSVGVTARTLRLMV
jgi:hypothetical protein